MKRIFESHLCPLCGGRLKMGKAVYALDLGSSLFVVRSVPARICDQCGEEWIGDQTAGRIERLVEETKRRKSELEVLAF